MPCVKNAVTNWILYRWQEPEFLNTNLCYQRAKLLEEKEPEFTNWILYRWQEQKKLNSSTLTYVTKEQNCQKKKKRMTGLNRRMNTRLDPRLPWDGQFTACDTYGEADENRHNYNLPKSCRAWIQQEQGGHDGCEHDPCSLFHHRRHDCFHQLSVSNLHQW